MNNGIKKSEKIFDYNTKEYKIPRVNINNKYNQTINTTSFNNTNSSYNTLHNKTVPNNITNIFQNQFLKSYFISKRNNTLFSFHKYDNDLNPKFFFNTQYKIPDTNIFHKKLMLSNKKSFKKEIYQLEKERIENDIYDNKQDLKELEKIKLKHNFDTNKYKLCSYLDINKEDNKFLKQYPQKSYDETIKKIVRKELNDAKMKMKYNKRYHSENPNLDERICIKKLKRDKFISFNNPLIELNKYGTVSLYVDDGESMYKLMKDTMDECSKRYYYKS